MARLIYSPEELADGRRLAVASIDSLPASERGQSAACLCILIAIAARLQDLHGASAAAEFLELESARIRSGSQPRTH